MDMEASEPMSTLRPFESVLARARKFAAIIAADSGAAPAEVETAQKALDELTATYGLTDEDVAPEHRHPKSVIVRSRYREHKPRRDKDLALFCRVCLWYVVGELRDSIQRKTEIELPSKGLSVKLAPVFEIEASVTDREFWEWKDCFDHYAPDFVDHIADLREAQKQAAFNLKNGWAVFCEDNGVVPPLPKSTRQPSMDEALRALCMPGAKKVSSWQRGRKLPESKS